MPQYRKSDGALLETAASPINRGGEGAIFRIPVDSYRVAKIYLPGKADPQRLSKLQAMIVNPVFEFRPGKPVNLAWPLNILWDSGDNKFAGFVMPLVRMPLADLRTIFNPSARNKKGIPWKWGNSLSVAASLAGAVERVHQSNYVVGDLNADNILVTQDYSITIVDVDSFQVPRENSSEFYRCTVGKDEYTPPELQGCRFSEVTRERRHDNFALAVLIFQTLMDGKHPFSGVTDVDVPNLTRHCIQKGIFPYATYSLSNRRPMRLTLIGFLPH
jgi:DNA-binding helix-hairpin-helix protein with protein kinase domain